jgi:Fe2+ or Zn2+ uptake regulation protein
MILAALQAMRLRETRQRRLIATRLEELAASGTDFTTDELWHEVQQLEPGMGRATVFQTVERLVHAGLLDRVEFADGGHRYRVCGISHHHHVTCRECHRVVEIDDCLPSNFFSVIARNTGFDLEGHSIELFGRCADCREA